MPRTYPNALPLTRKVLRVLIALNLMLGVLVVLLLILILIVWPPGMTVLAPQPGAGNAARMLGLQTIMVFVICGVPLTHLILTRLLAIVDTVSAGDPFVAENAVRMTRIAWAVLGLAVLHLVISGVAYLASTHDAPIDVGRGFEITPWVAVLLLFVLARVFEQGTRMREELGATV